MLGGQAVAVPRVDELALVARVPLFETRRLRPCEIAHHADVLVERQGGVGAEHPVRAGTLTLDRDGTVGEQGADGATAQDVTLYAHDGEVCRFGAGRVLGPGHALARLDVQGAHIEIAHLPRDPAAADNRHHRSTLEADPARVEERRRVAAPERAAAAAAPNLAQSAVACIRAAAAGEVEDAPAFEKEFAFLGKEQAEASQVHLLLVHFHLREVRVVREVGRQVLGDAVLDVDAGGTIPRRWGIDGDVGRGPADGVRLDLQIVPCRRQVQTHQHRRVGYAEDAAAPGRNGHRSEVGPFVLPPHHAAELNPPDRRRPRPVAERLEGDFHLDRPAALEAPRAHVPHRVPVSIGIALVGDGEVSERAERVGVEGDPVAAVVERVEGDPERVVLAELGRVALHLVCHPRRRRGRVPHAGGDVDVRRVEQNPGFRSLAGRRPLVRLLLDEVVEGGDSPVRRFVEDAVQTNAGDQPDGADGGPSLRVPGDDRGGRRWHRAVGHPGRGGSSRRGGYGGRRLTRIGRARLKPRRLGPCGSGWCKKRCDPHDPEAAEPPRGGAASD